MDLSADLYPLRIGTPQRFSRRSESPELFSRRLPLLSETGRPRSGASEPESTSPRTESVSSTDGRAIFLHSLRRRELFQPSLPVIESALHGRPQR
nr:MAG TPA: hypothetical protein [Caudoviricetes sp.]